MIIKAKHNKLLYLFFKIYTKRILKKYFNKINVIGNFNDCKLPVLVICNHISWWDGFWIMFLNMKLLNRRFYFMMIEEQLIKYKWFKYLGAFSVRKKSKSVLETLRYATDLLRNSDNLLLVFPQGKIRSIYEEKIIFEKGIKYILNETSGRIQILFVANLIDYFSHKKPTLNIYFQEFKLDGSQINMIEHSYNKFYESCIRQQISLES